MTAARQERNGGGWKAPFIVAFFAACAGSGILGAARATTTERVMVDRMSGLAISGYDPVGYFTEARPIAGISAIGTSHDGAIWRFRNEGNRIAFMAHPEIYAPRFGGYDPVDVASGKAVETYPSLWLVAGGRLYLFSSEANRAAFSANALRYIETADRRWPALREGLAQ